MARGCVSRRRSLPARAAAAPLRGCRHRRAPRCAPPCAPSDKPSPRCRLSRPHGDSTKPRGDTRAQCGRDETWGRAGHTHRARARSPGARRGGSDQPAWCAPTVVGAAFNPPPWAACRWPCRPPPGRRGGRRPPSAGSRAGAGSGRPRGRAAFAAGICLRADGRAPSWGGRDRRTAAWVVARRIRAPAPTWPDPFAPAAGGMAGPTSGPPPGPMAGRRAALLR